MKKGISIVNFCMVLFLLLPGFKADRYNNPAVFYTTSELICSEGYPAQEHKVTTKDGYILTIHRIPNGKRRSSIAPKETHYQFVHRKVHPDFESCMKESMNEKPIGPPVLLAHGLVAASDHWVLQGPGFDLAYLLSDLGYDVWFTNIRGNFYSRAHVSMKPSDPKFWDFCFDENGFWDVPAIIDYILLTTKYEKLFYVGHSMGTTMFFVMASSRPEYNKKVQVFVGLTPVTQIKQENYSFGRRGSLGLASKLMFSVAERGVRELAPRRTSTAALSRVACSSKSILQNLCYDVIFSFLGHHSKLFLRDKLALITGHGLSGASVKSIIHYFQMVNVSSFQRFDYGPKINMKKYGQKDPPRYDLGKVTAPVALFYSEGDNVVAAKDVELLISLLPNVVEVEKLFNYSHVDYMWAYNAKDLIYTKVIALFDKFKM